MNKRKNSSLKSLVIVGLLIYFAFVMFDQQKVMHTKKIELKNIDDKIKQEMKVNEELNEQKEAINTDEYAEKVAREKLGMVKHGEKIFIDIDK